jgi:hypothetical protein
MGQVLTADNIPRLVKASSTTLTLATTYLGRPTRITVGGQQYRPSSTITLNTAINGFNGLETGTLSNTNSLYYVYAVVVSGTLGLIASLSDPSVGPNTFATTYKLVGSFYSSSSGNSIAGVVPQDSFSAVKVLTSTDSPHTVADADSFRTYLCNATSGNITVNLPVIANNIGREIIIKKTDSSANIVTIDANGSETINGALTNVLTKQDSTLHLVAATSGWQVVAVANETLVLEVADVSHNASTAADLATITLNPGTWMINALVTQKKNTSAGATFLNTGISTISTNLSGAGASDGSASRLLVANAAVTSSHVSEAMFRYISVTVATPIYLVIQSNITSGAMLLNGTLRAERRG